MTRINFSGLRNSTTTLELLAWGRGIRNIPTNVRGDVNALVFAAVLIVCSVAVGCSKEKPKPTTSNDEIPRPQVQSPALPAPTAVPVMQAENKPAAKKVVHKKPTTVNYTDKNYGVSFEYSRRYAVDTGDAAADVAMSNPVPMNFVQPGGIVLAVVELPETGFANTDFSSAFFDLSVNKSLTADQCNQFAVPAPKMVAAATPAEPGSQSADMAPTTDGGAAAAPEPASTTAAQNSTDQSSSNATAASTAAASDLKSDAKTTEAKINDSAQSDSASKRMLGNLELRATEAVTGAGTRQSDAKYFHLYQNGACYEFALNVTTVASDDGLMKHVDRDKVFDRLEKILATVKIDEVKPAQDANKVDPTTPTVAQGPAK